MDQPCTRVTSSTFSPNKAQPMARRFLLLLACIYLSMQSVPIASIVDETSKSAITGLPPSASPEEAAQRGMHALPTIVTPETAELFGFESHDDASIAQIDLKSPWVVYTLDVEDHEYVDPTLLLKKTNMVFYPITVRGKVKSSLTVAVSQKDRKWTTTAWGSSGLIQRLTLHKRSVSSIVVRIPEFNLYFVGDLKEGQLMLTPIKNVPQFKFIEGNQLTAQEVLARLSSAVKTRKPTEPRGPQKPG
jgi:hypothetical protein